MLPSVFQDKKEQNLTPLPKPNSKVLSILTGFLKWRRERFRCIKRRILIQPLKNPSEKPESSKYTIYRPLEKIPLEKPGSSKDTICRPLQ